MTELRQNPLNGYWTIFAPERREKPRGFDYFREMVTDGLPEHDPLCPFCPGNEERFPLQIVNEMNDDQGIWVTRIIANKYKIFDEFKSCPPAPEPFKRRGIYSYAEGCGNHLLVVEGRSHNVPLGAMGMEEIRNTLLVYRDASLLLKVNPNNRMTIMYKNQGTHAGASQVHAHSQIVGSCIVPAWVRNSMHVQDKYYDDYGTCALCAMMDYELSVRERVVYDTGNVVAISPYAASAPYEIWIVPKRHFCCYEEITDAEIGEMASVLKKVLGAYITKLGNPDFNYLIHNAPHLLSSVPSHHIYLQILPRLAVPGGFETGTHIPVNTVWPEDVPQLLAVDS